MDANKDGNQIDINELLARQQDQRRLIAELQKLIKKGASPRETSAWAEAYSKHKETARTRQAVISRSGRDIAPLPSVVNPSRKDACTYNFRLFCETYFRHVFTLAWSPDHLKIIGKIERAVLHGGLFAHAMPRGSGKTSLAMAAAIWAALYGHRKYVCLVAASSERAKSLLHAIQLWLETNDLLLEDFPEALYPIRKLQRIVNRQRGQLYNGEPTRIEWTTEKIVLPTIPGSRASGCIITTSGLKGSELRGQMHVLADGRVIRPDLAIIDDPQTRESAFSVAQCQQREAIVMGDVLGMAGPGQKIAAIMCCTVIRQGDLADRLLDHKLHPEWSGDRTQLLYSFPKRMELWEKYWELYSSAVKYGDTPQLATDFYIAHREEMDDGAAVAWQDRHNPDEVSAIQHAMNLFFRDQAAFYAEYQNTPRTAEDDNEQTLTADAIAAKTNSLPRGIVPLGATTVTAFIDVHQNLLYYCVTAWKSDCTGYIIDYGTWPSQPQVYFLMDQATNTLARQYPNAGLEGAIYAGLTDLTTRIIGAEWRGENDAVIFKINRCLIDANWGQCTDLIYEFCRRSKYASVLLPSHGRFIGASTRPIHALPRHVGDQVGLNWKISSSQTRFIRYAIYDSNFWKSWIYARLHTAVGNKGSLTLFGDSPATHRLFAEHITAEYKVTVSAKDRVVDEWKQKLGRPDNHFFDALVGCAVAASMCGIEWLGQTTPRTVISFTELQRQRRMLTQKS